MRSIVHAIPAVLALSAQLTGCRDMQSALAPLGPEAERVALLAWVLFMGGAIVMAAVMALTALAMFGSDRWRSRLRGEAVVVGGGIVLPVTVLTALLVYGLLAMRPGQAATGEEPLRVTVVGEQWWWRVVYEGAAGRKFEAANEVRIPTGRRTKISLVSADVIHSFWVPNLAGKVDMIPGRTNTISLNANRPGISRGQCSEYCGGAHALMAFNVVAMEPADFDTWKEVEAGPAVPRGDEPGKQGELLFVSSGCGACHTIRGTEARGTIGPDLTHLGSRTSLAAGILPNNVEAIAAWIVDNQHIKPENRMPPFGFLDDSELAVLSAYLASLK